MAFEKEAWHARHEPVEATKLIREEFEQRFGDDEEAIQAQVKAAKTKKMPFSPKTWSEYQ